MEHQSNIQEYILGGREKMVLLPENFDIEGAQFSRSDCHLVITSTSHIRVFISGYFTNLSCPALLCGDGRHLSGEMVQAFMNLSPRAKSALLDIECPSDGQTDALI